MINIYIVNIINIYIYVGLYILVPAGKGPSLNCACHGFDGCVDIVTDDASTAPATTIGNR